MRFFVFMILVINKGYIIDCAKELKTLGRIINGHDAEMGQFPYAVRLETIIAFCSGSLIGSKWVLTAAHCVAEFLPAVVYVGSIVTGSDDLVYHVPTYDIHMHPGYKQNFLGNDIALIKIPFTTFNKKIGVVPLPSRRSKSNNENAHAVVCGWGKTSKKGLLSKSLQWGRFRILNARECRPLVVSKKQICATGSDLATLWEGDSGSPLVLETTGELVGIASSVNLKHCNNGYRAVFSRVTSYLDWIKFVSGISY